MNFKKVDWSKLLVAIVIANLAGFIGSFFTSSKIPTWYATLIKPTFNPPSWLFGPVWTTLYILMGISLYLIWVQGWKKKEVKLAISVFAVQLILNSLWSILFFGMQFPFLALIEIIILLVAIVTTMFLFYKLDKRAAYILGPYLGWVCFASILNFFIWRLNI